MQLKSGIFPATNEDFPRILQVWEAFVRATHDFVSEADIQVFIPLVQNALPEVKNLVCVRDESDQVAGLVA
jgi:putative acetyltransferase